MKEDMELFFDDPVIRGIFRFFEHSQTHNRSGAGPAEDANRREKQGTEKAQHLSEVFFCCGKLIFGARKGGNPTGSR